MTERQLRRVLRRVQLRERINGEVGRWLSIGARVRVRGGDLLAKVYSRYLDEILPLNSVAA